MDLVGVASPEPGPAAPWGPSKVSGGRSWRTCLDHPGWSSRKARRRWQAPRRLRRRLGGSSERDFGDLGRWGQVAGLPGVGWERWGGRPELPVATPGGLGSLRLDFWTSVADIGQGWLRDADVWGKSSTILFFTGQVSQPIGARRERRFGSCFFNLTNAVIRMRQFLVFEIVKGKSSPGALFSPRLILGDTLHIVKKKKKVMNSHYLLGFNVKLFSCNDQLLGLFYIWFLVFRLLLCMILSLEGWKDFCRCSEGLLESKSASSGMLCSSN